jgi:hypothetical protein
MPDFRSPLIDERGRLDDFEGGFLGESRQAMEATREGGRRRRWGNRQLLSVMPDQNPFLGGLVGKTAATLVDTGDLGRVYPINIQVRFALVDSRNGQPVLPFTDLNPPIDHNAGPPVKMTFTLRRGVDPQAQMIQDVYNMPDMRSILDAAPFDTVMARSLGVDVSLTMDAGLVTQKKAANMWVEAVATVNDQVGVRDTLPGYVDKIESLFIPASATPVLLARKHVARCQLIICNHSANADLLVLFAADGDDPVSATNATMVLPAGGANVYESLIGGWSGDVYGVWVGSPLDSGAFVTTGTYKTLVLP